MPPRRKKKSRPKEEPLPALPSRGRAKHKGDFGRVMLVAGSRGMAGAAVLAAEGAYRSGAGLVYLCVPNRIADIVAAKQTCAVIRPQEDTFAGALSPAAVAPLLEFGEECDVTAIGPGLGEEEDTQVAIRQLIQKLEAPVVADADGINAFAGESALLRNRRAPLILTPHPGEFARFLDVSISSVQADRERIARTTASRLRCVVVLKGRNTVVTNGMRTYVNETGNPGMATGGTGDVLTGAIAALLGQGMKPYEAAVLGVYLHGLAGDFAADRLGEYSMMATDVVQGLPLAFEARRKA